MNEPESRQRATIAEPHRVRMPWSPTGIAVLSLLLSPLPGGVLHALNYARLGLPERKRLALFSNLIAAMVLALIPFLFEGVLRGTRSASALLVAAYFYKTQEGLFQRHVSAGGQKGSLLVPGILSILAVAALAIIIALMELG